TWSLRGCRTVSTRNEPDRSDEPSGSPSERPPSGGRHRPEAAEAPQPRSPSSRRATDGGEPTPDPADGEFGGRKRPTRESEQEFVVASVERTTTTLRGGYLRLPERGCQGKSVFVHLDTHATRLGEEARRFRESVRGIEHRVRPPDEDRALGDAGIHLEHRGDVVGARTFRAAETCRGHTSSSDVTGRREDVSDSRSRARGERPFVGPADHAAHHRAHRA